MAELEAHVDHYALFVAASQTAFPTAPAKIIRLPALGCLGDSMTSF